MIEPSRKKKTYKPSDRVTLSHETRATIDGLTMHLAKQLPTIKLTRTELVNWILTQREQTFSQKELSAIERHFFDPVKAIESALSEAKKQQNLGVQVDFEQLMCERVFKKRRRTRKLSTSKPKPEH